MSNSTIRRPLLGALVVGLTGYCAAIAGRVRPRHPWIFWPLLAEDRCSRRHC